MRTALEVVFAIALVVISAPFAFSIWSRRGDRKPDRPGERTVVTFRGGEPQASDENVAKAIAEALRKRGVSVDAPDADDFGWGMHATRGEERAYLLVGRMERDEDDDAEWLLRVVDPTSGGPGPAAFVAHVDEALRALGFTSVTWQRR